MSRQPHQPGQSAPLPRPEAPQQGRAGANRASICRQDGPVVHLFRVANGNSTVTVMSTTA